MGKASRDKGARGEREVEGVFRSHGLDCWRTPNSGALRYKGDLDGLPEWHIEVKRQEVPHVFRWIAQVWTDAGYPLNDAVPVVIFRRSKQRAYDPAGEWNAIIPLDVLCALIVKAGT